MPAVPPGLSEWLALLTQPTVILVGVGLLINQQNQQINDLREDVKGLQKDLKDMQAGQSRLNRLLGSRLTPHPQ
ncbi:hypothetical protein [Candidatus Synechococcus spongiarum]|uniref:Uncharacterized protein n=1 Tax=Candidatus Synechococcus spongiarum TaxID=431041 RepID=A0A161KFE9_9SYNE|nr:hypothetical protein [Candidatus Synechococcus spongiarum]CZB14576.1 hypothetical protein FLM9_509 [Candidatus Synechococcus spongiarum]